MLTGSFVGTNDGMLCLIIGADGPHGPAVHWIRHAQVVQRGLEANPTTELGVPPRAGLLSSPDLGKELRHRAGYGATTRGIRLFDHCWA